MNSGPNYNVIDGDWRHLAIIIADLSRIIDESASFSDYILKDGSRAYTGTGVGFKDEDDLVSDLADATASQQSIKAYVDTTVGDMVTAVAVLTDNSLIRGDGGVRGVQDSSILIDDSDNMSGVGTLSSGVITQSGTTLALTYHPLTTVGIAQNNLIKASAADVASGEYAKFTATGLESKTFAEVLADLSGQAGAAFDWNTQNLTNIGTIGSGAITCTALDAGSGLIQTTGAAKADGGFFANEAVTAANIVKIMGGANGETGQRVDIDSGAGLDDSTPDVIVAAGDGGTYFMTGGDGGNASGGTVASLGGGGAQFGIFAGDGGDGTASGATFGTGGTGGLVSLVSGSGGNATGTTSATNTSGDGGPITFITGSAGSAANGGTNTQGDGGNMTFQTGLGLVDGKISFQVGNTTIGIFLADASGLLFDDNLKIFWGTTNKGSISHDGTDLIIDPAEVGTGSLKLLGGRINDTSRYTANQTLDSTDYIVYCDTDGGSFTATLPAAPVDGRTYRIINTGSSNNALTIDENGNALLGSVNTLDLLDGDVLIITFETTEGWW